MPHTLPSCTNTCPHTAKSTPAAALFPLTLPYYSQTRVFAWSVLFAWNCLAGRSRTDISPQLRSPSRGCGRSRFSLLTRHLCFIAGHINAPPTTNGHRITELPGTKNTLTVLQGTKNTLAAAKQTFTSGNRKHLWAQKTPFRERETPWEENTPKWEQKTLYPYNIDLKNISFFLRAGMLGRAHTSSKPLENAVANTVQNFIPCKISEIALGPRREASFSTFLCPVWMCNVNYNN